MAPPDGFRDRSVSDGNRRSGQFSVAGPTYIPSESTVTRMIEGDNGRSEGVGKGGSAPRYHCYHPIVCRSWCVAGEEEQRAGLAIHLNRHLPALVTWVQYDLVDERPQNRCSPSSDVGFALSLLGGDFFVILRCFGRNRCSSIGPNIGVILENPLGSAAEEPLEAPVADSLKSRSCQLH